jgi:hypothetical protein
MSVLGSRVLAWGRLLAAWAAGVGLGVLLGRSREESVPRGRPPAASRASATPAPTPSSPPPPGESRRLRESLARKEAELKAIERQITAALERPPGARTRDEKLKLAKELYEAYRRIVQTNDNDAFLALIKRFGELDADTAGFFAEQYRATHAEENSHVPLELVLWSGGRDASALVLEILSSGDYSESERMTILEYLDGVSAEVPIGAKLAVDGDLLEKARQLAGGEKAWERKGGAGLLGFSKSAEATPPLRHMAESDPDPGAKMAAYRALGRTQDPSNVAYLEEAQRDWEVPAPKDKPIPLQAETQKAIRAALQQLRQELLR